MRGDGGGGLPSCFDLALSKPCDGPDSLACMRSCWDLNIDSGTGTCYMKADGSRNCTCCSVP